MIIPLTFSSDCSNGGSTLICQNGGSCNTNTVTQNAQPCNCVNNFSGQFCQTPPVVTGMYTHFIIRRRIFLLQIQCFPINIVHEEIADFLST